MLNVAQSMNKRCQRYKHLRPGDKEVSSSMDYPDTNKVWGLEKLNTISKAYAYCLELCQFLSKTVPYCDDCIVCMEHWFLVNKTNMASGDIRMCELRCKNCFTIK